MQALRAIRPRTTFAWSPAFWYPYSIYSNNSAGMAGLTAMLTDFFSGMSTASAGIQLIDLQDFVPGSSCQPPDNRMTPQDAVAWSAFLAGLHQIPELTINVEQYEMDCATGGVYPGDPQEVTSREAFYSAHGLTLGAPFEIRYWLPAHGISPSL